MKILKIYMEKNILICEHNNIFLLNYIDNKFINLFNIILSFFSVN